jgi:ABC-type multidrug transport system fused ATPase/permease subunit
MRITELLRRHRRGVGLALGLVLIERIAWVAEPSAFGPVIDAFVDWRGDQAQLPPLLPVLIWIGLFATNSLVGSLRRPAEARIYGRMFADLAGVVSQQARDQRLESAQAVARGDLNREFIEFLQFRLPEAVEEIVSLGGALVGLAFYDWRLALACGAAALPLGWLTTYMALRVAALQVRVHDLREQSFRAYATEAPDQVRAHYQGVADLEVQIARKGSLVFGAMRVCLLAIFLVVLYVAIDLDDFTTGKIYSIVAYIWTFITSSEYIPELAQSWTSLRDLSARMAVQGTN